MPDLHKAAKRTELRLRLEPYRPRRKRLTLQALYDRDGALVIGENSIGKMIANEWLRYLRSATLTKRTRRRSPSYLRFRLARVPHGHEDALPKWRHECHLQPNAETYIDEAAEFASRGGSLLAVMLASHTAFPPKGEDHEDAARAGGMPRRRSASHETR